MPRYGYVCACGEPMVRTFAMREVPATAMCARCGKEASRVFAVPQIRVSSLCSEANTRGLAELDSTRWMDERAYARNWNRRLQPL